MIPANAFQKGNQLWKLRPLDGRPRMFSTAGELAKACYEYFQWVDENPLYEARAMIVNGDVQIVKVPRMRAMTVMGMCAHMGTVLNTWREWRRGARGPDYAWVCECAEHQIYEQKFVGAAASLFNANIIARDLGLVERTELTGPEGGPLQMITAQMSPNQAAEAWLETVQNVTAQIEDQRDATQEGVQPQGDQSEHSD